MEIDSDFQGGIDYMTDIDSIYRSIAKAYILNDAAYHSKISDLNVKYAAKNRELDHSLSSALRNSQNIRERAQQILESKRSEVHSKAVIYTDGIASVIQNANDIYLAANLEYMKMAVTLPKDMKTKIPVIDDLIVNVDSPELNFPTYLAEMKRATEEASVELTKIGIQVGKLNLFRQNRAERQKRVKILLAIIISIVGMTLSYIGTDIYKQYRIKQIYNRAIGYLRNEKWKSVNEEIMKISNSNSLDYNSICGSYKYKYLQAGVCTDIVVQMMIIQREAFLRQALQAYSEEKWNDALYMLERIDDVDIKNKNTIFFTDRAFFTFAEIIPNNYRKYHGDEKINNAKPSVKDDAKVVFHFNGSGDGYHFDELVKSYQKESETPLNVIPSIKARISGLEFFSVADSRKLSSYYGVKSEIKFPLQSVNRIGYRYCIDYPKQVHSTVTINIRLFDQSKRNIYQYDYTRDISDTKTPVCLYFDIPRPDGGWKDGTYRLIISHNGNIVTNGTFEIY